MGFTTTTDRRNAVNATTVQMVEEDEERQGLLRPSLTTTTGGSLTTHENDDDGASSSFVRRVVGRSNKSLLLLCGGVLFLSGAFACAGYASEIKSATTTMGTRYDHHKPEGYSNNSNVPLLGTTSSTLMSSTTRGRVYLPRLGRGRWSRLDDDDDDSDDRERRYSSRRRYDDDDEDDDDDADEHRHRPRAASSRRLGEREDDSYDDDDDKQQQQQPRRRYSDDDSDERDRGRSRRSDDSDDDSEEEEEEDEALKETCVGEAADEEKGIYQYPDKICLSNPSLTPACLGNGGSPTACRFCQTEEAVRKVAGWPQCPHSVCEKSSGIGCVGDSFSKTEIGWRMHVKDIAKHNARVKQIGISGTCDSTVSDQAVGRHMFRDKKCSERLLPGCQDAQGCRFCVTKSGAKLDAEKVTAQWPTCPAAVCARFGLEKNDCEATLGLYVVPSFDVPEGFEGTNLPKPKLDLEATQKMQERLKQQIKAAMIGQDDPVFDDADDDNAVRAARAAFAEAAARFGDENEWASIVAGVMDDERRRARGR